MRWVVVDVEADADSPATGSMVSFGAVFVANQDLTFFGECAPITDSYYEDNLSISGVTRSEHLDYRNPLFTMVEFQEWLTTHSSGQPIFVSDNPAFDWQWINYYFDKFLGHRKNPFGYSGRRISDIWCGLNQDMFAKWKHLRDTVADHNPVNDAKANAEALVKMKEMFNLKLKF